MCWPGTSAEIIAIVEPLSWLTGVWPPGQWLRFFLISRKYRKNKGLVRDFSKAHALDWTANATTHHLLGCSGRWCKAAQCQLVSTSINLYQLVSTCINSSASLSVKKSPFRVTLQEKCFYCCLWLKSRIRAHDKLPEAEQVLGLFQYIYLFALYQPSSSNLHYQMKKTKV